MGAPGRAVKRLLWSALRFRRQHPIGPYVLDFYCLAICLAVEIDGAAHNIPDQAGHDLRRDAWLAAQRIQVPRVLAADVERGDARRRARHHRGRRAE